MNFFCKACRWACGITMNNNDRDCLSASMTSEDLAGAGAGPRYRAFALRPVTNSARRGRKDELVLADLLRKANGPVGPCNHLRAPEPVNAAGSATSRRDVKKSKTQQYR